MVKVNAKLEMLIFVAFVLLVSSILGFKFYRSLSFELPTNAELREEFVLEPKEFYDLWGSSYASNCYSALDQGWFSGLYLVEFSPSDSINGVELNKVLHNAMLSIWRDSKDVKANVPLYSSDGLLLSAKVSKDEFYKSYMSNFRVNTLYGVKPVYMGTNVPLSEVLVLPDISFSDWQKPGVLGDYLNNPGLFVSREDYSAILSSYADYLGIVPWSINRQEAFKVISNSLDSFVSRLDVVLSLQYLLGTEVKACNSFDLPSFTYIKMPKLKEADYDMIKAAISEPLYAEWLMLVWAGKLDLSADSYSEFLVSGALEDLDALGFSVISEDEVSLYILKGYPVLMQEEYSMKILNGYEVGVNSVFYQFDVESGKQVSLSSLDTSNGANYFVLERVTQSG